MHSPDATRDPAPLIVTLALDPATQAHFEYLRVRWFPPERNLIPAHVSLFHALPGAEVASVQARLEAAAAAIPGFPVDVTGLMRLGRGVAFRLQSPPLATLHDGLRATWLHWLTPQDRQPYRPHIVVQNKAEPADARRLYDDLAAGFRPWTATAKALLLWRYRGGPWEAAGSFPFAHA